MRAAALAIVVAACHAGDVAQPAPSAVPAIAAAPIDAAPISHDDYAHLILDRLAAAGLSADYDRDRFVLTFRGDGGAGNQLSLANVYVEYIAAAPADRPAMLELVASLWLDPGSTPKSFLMAKARLRPLIRSGAYFDEATAAVRANASGPPGSEPITRPLDDLATIGIALDSDVTLAVVTHRELDGWHATWDDAMPIALDNLRAASADPFEQPSKGVFVSPWHDTYDAARLLLPDVIAKLGVRGKPVALIPNRDTLIIAGDRDAAALTAAADLADKAYVPPRQIDLIARCWDGAWKPCVPDATPAIAKRYRGMRDTSLNDLYAGQKERLDDETTAAGDDVFVASLMLTTDRHGETSTVAALTKGVRTLLPRADLIALVDPDRPDHDHVIGLVRWDDAFALLRARWTALPVSPPRWRVEADGFPTAAELARLPQVKP